MNRAPDPKAAQSAPTARHAFFVASGILLSRIAGLVRQRLLAHELGLSDAADAFSAAFRIPNFLQNMFGEGVLSASFVPVYARLLAEGEKREARRVALIVATLLGCVTVALVLLGVFAPDDVLGFTALGFTGEKRALTVHLARVLFPGAGLLVLSAWCLGVLNSHRRFLLSYAAPVLWNLAMIAALLYYGRLLSGGPLAEKLAFGSVVGSALQFLVQVPAVFVLVGGLQPMLSLASPHVREVLKNFVPVFIGRGVVQISAYIDQILASLLPSGAVTALAHAQVLYTLPVSLFGMSISAAELPEMSSALGTEREIAEALRARLERGLRRIAFFVVPSAMAFVGLGDVLAGALLQSGEFSAADSRYVWGILAGSSVGLLASTLGRLYASTSFALRDTRTPLRVALFRVVLSTGLGYLVGVVLPPRLGIEPRWGAVGLTLASGIAGWVELVLLRRAIDRRVGPTRLPRPWMLRLWLAAGLAAGAGFGLRSLAPTLHPWLLVLIAVAPYGLLYFGLTRALGIEESRAFTDRLLQRFTRRAR